MKYCPFSMALVPITLLYMRVNTNANREEIEKMGKEARCMENECQLWNEQRKNCGLKSPPEGGK